MSVDASGIQQRAGGLGASLGDEGSGSWIGKQAIYAAQQQARGETLRSAVEQALAIDDLRNLILRPAQHTTLQPSAQQSSPWQKMAMAPRGT